jgi:hypothetical protein
MGYIKHDAIVVVSCKDELLEAAHAKAKDLDLVVTDIGARVVNFYRSFLICPDGSKEGWDRSDDGDAAREAFLQWCREQRYEDGSNSLDWVHVRFGGDDAETEVRSEREEQARERGGSDGR